MRVLLLIAIANAFNRNSIWHWITRHSPGQYSGYDPYHNIGSWYDQPQGYNPYAQPVATRDTGISRFPVPEAWKDNGRFEAQWREEAEQAKLKDPDAPMTFLNLYGTCWLVAAMQFVMALPGIGHYIWYIPEGRFRHEMRKLWSQAESGAAVASLDGLRGTLDEEFQTCTAHAVVNTLKHVIEKMHIGHDVLMVDFAIDPVLYAQRVSYIETLLANRRYEIGYNHPHIIISLLSSHVYTVTPMEIRVTNYFGVPKRYRLVAVSRASDTQQGVHAITHALVTSKATGEEKWYTLDNHYARLADPAVLGYGASNVVAYQLVDSH